MTEPPVQDLPRPPNLQHSRPRQLTKQRANPNQFQESGKVGDTPEAEHLPNTDLRSIPYVLVDPRHFDPMPFDKLDGRKHDRRALV
jgi:hypothetical protein